MNINNKIQISGLNNNNRNSINFTGQKKYTASSNDTAEFSSREKAEKPNSLKQKILNIFKIKSKKNEAVSAADLEKAQQGFKAYQFQAQPINTVLRNSSTLEEALSRLSQMSKNFSNGDEIETFFVEKGYDLLSEELTEDLTVYRYIYSSEDYEIDWKIGDKKKEKGFISTTLDSSENSYAKYFVKKNLEEANKYSDVKGQFYTMEITIPKGTKVVKGDNRMSEVLLKYNSSFEITDFNSETNTYKCKIIK